MPTILIADDDPQQLLLRSLLLERSGYRVWTALSAAEVHRRIDHGTPGVLIMDLRFPNAQGEPDPEEGLALIRGLHLRVPGLPVIVLSGWPEALETRPEAHMVTRILVKPCRLEVMLEAIEEARAQGAGADSRLQPDDDRASCLWPPSRATATSPYAPGRNPL
jgi:CheY-like chemotaxis protein